MSTGMEKRGHRWPVEEMARAHGCRRNMSSRCGEMTEGGC
jgi:hypothetical protein